MTDTRSNYQWMLDSINEAMTMERLEALGNAIKYDADQKVDYTLDPDGLATLREAWAKRAREIK